MKNERKDNPLKAIPDEILDHCNFDTEKGLVATISPGLLIVSSTQMTAMDTITAITTISEFGASLTAKLAAACGFCDNCGDMDYGNPTDWAKNCELCSDLLNTRNYVQLPDYLRIEAGIPQDAKLDADIDDKGGNITVFEADHDHDITDVPPDLLEVFCKSGVCLAALDEALRQERKIDVI